MAYDFPNAPTLGQVYNGYTWDGEKWVQSINAPNQSGVIAIKVFTASGAYTPSANMTTCVIECVGGGGGSGGVTGSLNAMLSSGAGGSGSYSRTFATAAQIGASQPVTIGAGGIAGASNTNGAVGGPTSVGTLCTTNGGIGGGWNSTAGGGFGFGGGGGAVGTGSFAAPGNAGQSGVHISTGGAAGWAGSPIGAPSPFGGSPNTVLNSVGATGLYGSGASGAQVNGAAASFAGAAGGNGLVVITEYGMTALSSSTIATGAVRFDLPQGLSANQQAQARSNIGALKKNYVINGAMMVSQENGATSSGATAWWPADMFGFFCNYGGGHQVQQVASVTPAGSPNRIRLTITTADAAVGATDYIQLIQTIEGLRMADLRAGTAAAKTVTLQFGVKAPAGTWSIAFKNGAADRYYIAEYVISAGEANTDVMKSVTLTLDQTGTWAKDNTAGMMISWNWMFGANYQGTSAGSWLAGNGYALASHSNLAATVGNIAEIFDVSLTEGTVAPPFMVPDYASELAACQRYWRLIKALSGVAFSTTSVALMGPHHAMRAAPTATLTGALSITDVFSTNPTQSSAHVASVSNSFNEGTYNFDNFTGLTSGRFYMVNSTSAGLLALNARL